MVRNLIQIQDAYINTYHPDFMGGINSIVNVFDVGSYSKEQMAMMQMPKAGDSFSDMANQGSAALNKAKAKFGADLIVKNKNSEEEHKGDHMGESLNDGRLRNFNESEIQKYMQNNVKPVHLPDMPVTMRAENQDPGQSSPRSQLETHIIKNLIVSYFNTVRKSMNDMVPKTIMAFLVNKTKNMA